ncbi:class C sortase [Bifidobacterium sp. ESL0800]|uniref:class C sortase n=1 Tax=Bifidobacterium sp. ESL0800 TaxID=2983236 RepID=UPI0023F8CC1D|nr:class C sortase [Bifidobacterium sp. ESL0800]WEV75791.1 class C sortase [Bifidobacterium sp. ESL0800]
MKKERFKGSRRTVVAKPLGALPFWEVVRRRRSNARFVRRLILQCVHNFCVIAVVIVILWVPVNRMISARNEAIASAQAAAEMARWPRGHIKQEYHDAQRYNADIARSGQFSLGKTSNPFAQDAGNDEQSFEDKRYQSLLKTKNGVMGTIRIPKISLRLPIYHGTSKDVLQVGVGHLHGTSLPVGGKSTNSVLTGHRGLVDAELFTRLDELKKGDVIYIQTLNRTMGYRVKAINVVSPTDVHLYKVVPGRDLVTLMTCTPYGVNTERLVITAERGNIPKDIPRYDGSRDAVLVAVLVAIAIFLPGLLWLLARSYRLLLPPPRHYDGTPDAGWTHMGHPRVLSSLLPQRILRKL